MKKEENSYSIEKDTILNKWIVWEIHKNAKYEVHRSKTKKDCKKWLEENVK